MSRARRVTTAAVLGCALSALACAAPASAASGGTSGYVAEGGRYTSVSANWTQKSVSCAGSSAESENWVGLDGFGDSTVEQAGTSTECSGGSPVMSAWWELYPSAPVSFSGAVSAGDKMSASVSTDGAGTFTMTVADVSKGWSQSARHTAAGAALSSAEVVTAFSDGTGDGVRPAGSVLASFSGALVNGKPLGDSDPGVTQAPGTLVSALTGGEAFTVTRSTTG